MAVLSFECLMKDTRRGRLFIHYWVLIIAASVLILVLIFTPPLFSSCAFSSFPLSSESGKKPLNKQSRVRSPEYGAGSYQSRLQAEETRIKLPNLEVQMKAYQDFVTAMCISCLKKSEFSESHFIMCFSYNFRKFVSRQPFYPCLKIIQTPQNT